MSYSATHNPNLYQWKRFTQPKVKSKKESTRSKEDDIQSWLEKVEAATDKAVRQTLGGSHRSFESRSRHFHYKNDDILQTVSRIHDDQDAYAEAQEIVSDWVNEKIRYNFLETDEIENEYGILEEKRDTKDLTAGIETAVHEKWYEDSEMFMQRYLDSGDKRSRSRKQQNNSQRGENDVLGQVDIYDADEDAVVKALMKNMMEKPLIKTSELKSLKKRQIHSDGTRTNKFRNPKTTMDMRHKEVKEARLRRQREEEKRKQERMIQKEAKFKAQQILKEEEAQRKIREKQEEEAIQAEMAKLRKEMVEQRKREEKDRREREKENEKVKAVENEERMARRQEMEKLEREKQKEKILSEISRLEEKENRVAEVMRKRNAENRKLKQLCFASWCKIVLNQRVKMGKAKAMADWKCMQHAWSAWKTYTRNQKLDIETRNHQANMRDAILKGKKAMDCMRLRLLRKCFLKWKVWVTAEQEQKEILAQQEITKTKMQALLDAVSSGSIGKKKSEDLTALRSIDDEDVTEDLPHFKTQKPKNIRREKKRETTVPKEAWQVTKKHVRQLKPEDLRQIPSAPPSKVSQQMKLPGYDPYENRHKFQKELIEQQRMLLNEQKRMIEEMQEKKRLQALQEEIAVLQQQQKALEKNQNKTPSEIKAVPRNVDAPAQLHSARSEPSQVTSAKKHPIVSKMEERAAERAKRKKELEESKRRREEEKLKRMQEEEERKQKEEQERKIKEIQARREAKRLQKKMEEEKKAAQERMRELCRTADNHHTASLMKNYGFKPWRKLVESVKRKEEVATYHYNSVLAKTALLSWQEETARVADERQQKADSLCQFLLLRRGMRSWKKYGERMEILDEKATIHRNRVLKNRYLKFWADYVTDEKLALWDKEARADAHDRLRLLRRVFNVIRSYRELIKRESERRQRLDEMRRKVTQLLPDFQLPNESLTSAEFIDDENVELENEFP